MATDYVQKEREFLSELKADTGRDLSEWMQAIRAQGFTDKNEVIDWLRAQGFMFWKASWLERVHNNGGRPIYADPSPARADVEAAPPLQESAADRAAPAPLRTPAAPAAPPVPAPTRPAAPPAAARPVPATPADQSGAPESDLAAVLARAKGYRPLAEHLLRWIRTALPATRVAASGSLVVLSDRSAYAAMALSAREIRLGLALGDTPAAAPWVRARLPGAPDHIGHVIVLNDARQIGPALHALIREAHARAAT